MNKKAFTLAEMLGVISILAILGLIVFPVVDKALKDGKDELYKVQVSNIEQGAIQWASDNIFIAPVDNDEYMYLTLYQLKQAGKVDKNVKDPRDKKVFSDDLLVKITKSSSNYKAELLVDSAPLSLDDEYNSNRPAIDLKGDELVYFEYKASGQTYIDEGVVASYIDETGNEVTPVITSVIKDNMDNVVLSITADKVGEYMVYYDATVNDIRSRVVRTVIVKDTMAPTITVPSGTRVSRSNAASYNLINTVSVSDESNYTIISDRQNLPSVAGNYTITYTATDEYGNESIARRQIEVY